MACPRRFTSSLLQRQRLAGGHTKLPFDEIEARDLLRDRMLDLQPRVHLHEIELAAAQQELDGAGADVAHFARDGAGRGVEPARVSSSSPARALLR